MVTIEIKNQQKRIPLKSSSTIKIVQKILKHQGVRQADLSVAFVTDRKMQALNKKFLQHDHPTDVLSFDWQPPKAARVKVRKIEGEIIVSAVTAYNNAKRFKTSPYREVILCVVHGLLHLLGYDDRASGERKTMRAKEKELMALI